MGESAMHEEVHVFAPLGHHMSVDCWCEPVTIQMLVRRGIKVLVVEHDDTINIPHATVLAFREKHKAVLYAADQGIDAPWITRLLASSYKPPLLPPHKES